MQGVYNHLSFLEQVKADDKQLITESNLLYTEYDLKINAFFERFYDSELIDYEQTLLAYDVFSEEGTAKAILTENFQLLKAILTKVIHEERFVSGAFIH